MTEAETKLNTVVETLKERLITLNKMIKQDLRATKKYCWDDPSYCEITGEITGHQLEKDFILNTLINIAEIKPIEKRGKKGRK